MTRVLAFLLAGGLMACAETRPSPVVSPGLESGVTSNNGGGQRALNNNQNQGVTTRVGPGQ